MEPRARKFMTKVMNLFILVFDTSTSEIGANFCFNHKTNPTPFTYLHGFILIRDHMINEKANGASAGI